MIQKLITDQQLSDAAVQVRCTMLGAFSDKFPCQFTPAFESRVDELRKIQHSKAKHRQIRKRVIAATVALFLLASLLLGLNPEVRAAVSKWFKEVFDTYTHYWFTEEPIATLPESVEIAVPDGYELILENMTANTKTIVYQKGDDMNDGFLFEYGRLLDDAPLRISFPTDQFYVEYVTINGLPGDLYISLTPDESHGLLWIDEANGIYFSISSYFSPELIVELAESVKMKK